MNRFDIDLKDKNLLDKNISIDMQENHKYSGMTNSIKLYPISNDKHFACPNYLL